MNRKCAVSSALLAAAVTASAAVVVQASDDDNWKYGLNGARGFNENTYSTISRQTEGKSDSNWRDGSMTGNGEMGIIESCDPAEDVIIFNNTKLVLGSNEIYDVADVSANLDSIRKTAADRTNPGQWQGWVKQYWGEKYGNSNHLSSSTKMYHPAAQLRIKNNDYDGNDSYNRYTNFESGEIGMQWKKDGEEYNSRTFISRADGVAVTIIEAQEGETLNLSLSIDNLLEMGIDSTAMVNKGIEICPQSKEIIRKDDNGYSFGQIAKYGDFNISGNDDNPDAYGAKGGYATAIRLIADDSAIVTERMDTHNITANEKFNTSDPSQKVNAEINTPVLDVTGTSSIMLVSKVDVQLEGFNSIDDVEALYDGILNEVDTAIAKRSDTVVTENGTASAAVTNTTDTEKEYMLVSANYDENGRLEGVELDKKTVEAGGSVSLSVSDGDKVFLWDEKQKPYNVGRSIEEQYNNMLMPHKEIHGEMFSGTGLTLCMTDEEKADRELTNSELNKKQQSQSNINKAWLERLYDNGRFGLICASGYNTTRLGGIWVGNWMPDWSGDFTQDANLNLQVSAVNTMGMKDASQSFITYILRQVSDWEKNAKYIYGIDNAIMAGPRTDGDGNGTIYHTLAGYPFEYWNTGADWLIIPIYEYWQCYGNEKIPVGDDVDIEELTSVLDLTDEDKARITSEGFDLEQDILAPLITKLYNFWVGYTDDRFFISADGKEMHLNDGTEMGEDDKYMFTPGYSPENVPSKDGIGYNSSPSLAANTAMDISAAHNSMSMLRSFISRGIITDISIDEADSFESKFPEYLYGEDGALKEWAVADYEEHYNHRHVSHTYSAWPSYEAQDNYTLREGLATALDMRYTYNLTDNSQAHGHLHNGLVEARIKRVAEYEKCLHTLIASNYEYAALMTSHNKGHGSAFCTDNAFGLTGVVTEALIYSDTGVIEFLPTLIDDFGEGKITNLMVRTNVSVDSLEWNENEVKAVITSNSDSNTFKLMCGEAWTGVTVNGNEVNKSVDENGRGYITLTLANNESAEIKFTMNEVANGTYLIKTSDGYLNVESYADGAKTVYGDKAEKWNINFNADGTYSIINTYSGRVLTDNGIYRDSKYTWSDISGFTLEKQDTETPGSVADEIEISTSTDLTQEITAGKTIKFDVVKYVPGTAVAYGSEWSVTVDDGTVLTSTKFSGSTLAIGTDALGKVLKIYAASPDGSCVSNTLTVKVAATETKTVKTEMESYDYGFGNFKNEGTNLGTINGRAVIKFSNVNLSSLMSVHFVKSNMAPSKTTLYYDLAEAEDKTYYDDYSKDSGEGKGAASKRYNIDNITIDESKKISDTVAVAEGTVDVNIGILPEISGVHDLYVVIDPNGQTWSGNYDYMELIYSVGTTVSKLECEDLEYGFGNFLNEVTNIGTINNTAVLKFADVSFDDLSTINVVMTNSGTPAYVQFYRDLTEVDEKTYYTYDKDQTERDYRYNINDINIDESKAISEKITVQGIMPLALSETEGTGDLYMVIRKVSGTWAGNFDYLELNYKTIEEDTAE